jgi:protocatechuate 3,4-dioxygenase beta subunit
MSISKTRRAAAPLFLLVTLVLGACSGAGEAPPDLVPDTGPGAQIEEASQCAPTAPDMLGPFYEPGAPARDRVGEGYVLSGAVLSAADCTPVANAQIELWMAGPDGVYRDEYRATMFSDENGEYRFESHVPPPYLGRPPHIHIRVVAVGFRELVTQHYPDQGSTQASFDLVLEPAQ